MRATRIPPPGPRADRTGPCHPCVHRPACRARPCTLRGVSRRATRANAYARPRARREWAVGVRRAHPPPAPGPDPARPPPPGGARRDTLAAWTVPHPLPTNPTTDEHTPALHTSSLTLSQNSNSASPLTRRPVTYHTLFAQPMPRAAPLPPRAGCPPACAMGRCAPPLALASLVAAAAVYAAAGILLDWWTLLRAARRDGPP